MYRKYTKLIILFSLILYLFSGCNSSDDNYSALYFTSKDSALINAEECKEKNMLVVNSFDDLKLKFDSLTYKVGILLDKSILTDENEINNLNQWLLKQKGYPIIVIGYGKPIYVYFFILEFASGESKPKLNKEKLDEYKNQSGFSLAYICKDGKILGKGYEELNVSNILKTINIGLKGDKYVEEIVEQDN